MSQQTCSAAAVVHYFQLGNFCFPGVGILISMIAMLIRRDSAFIQNHCRIAINGTLTFVFCFYGLLFIAKRFPVSEFYTFYLIVLFMGWFAYCFGRATIYASRGRPCHYPLAIPFLHVDWQQDNSPGSETF